MPRSDDSQLNAHIPRELHKALKRASIEREASIKEILIKALSNEVNWKPKKKGK
jgi:predicted HicB family RNase H-like nuclease